MPQDKDSMRILQSAKRGKERSEAQKKQDKMNREYAAYIKTWLQEKKKLDRGK